MEAQSVPTVDRLKRVSLTGVFLTEVSVTEVSLTEERGAFFSWLFFWFFG